MDKRKPKEQPKEQSQPKKMGRPRNCETPEELIEWFLEYTEWVKNNPFLVQDYVGKDGIKVDREKARPITWKGFEAWIYREKAGWFTDTYWMKDEQFSPIITRLKECCNSENVDGASAGVYNAVIISRLVGLKEQSETTNETRITEVKVEVQRKDG